MEKTVSNNNSKMCFVAMILLLLANIISFNSSFILFGEPDAPECILK